ncbi:hypothetical protein, partial [Xanthomonas maliensis]
MAKEWLRKGRLPADWYVPLERPKVSSYGVIFMPVAVLALARGHLNLLSYYRYNMDALRIGVLQAGVSKGYLGGPSGLDMQDRSIPILNN